MEIWEPKPPGTLRATPGLLRYCFTFTFISAQIGVNTHMQEVTNKMKGTDLPGIK